MAQILFNPFTGNLDYVGSGGGGGGGSTTLAGDVTGSGTGTISTTVATVGTSTATNIHTAEQAANAATNLNTVSTIVKRDGSGNFSAGTITASLTGAASLNVLSSAVGSANGVASLDSGGKVPVSQLPSTVMEYQGAWNPSTNTPALSDGTGTAGFTYRVSTASSGTISGLTDSSMSNFQVGNLVIYSSALSKWQQAPSADGVISVNGSQGAVTVNAINQLTGDVAAGPASGSASAAATIQANVVSNSKLAQMAANTLKGNNTAGTANAADLTVAQANTLLGTITALTGDVTATGSGGSATATISNLAVSKLAALGTSLAVVSDSGGKLTTSATTATQIGYLSTATSDIQTQLNSKASASAGDIAPSTFAAANNQSAAANVTGLAFANASITSFEALISIKLTATASLFQTVKILGIQKASSWEITEVSAGDDTGIVFSITTAGQIQYTSTNQTGWTATAIKFRASVL